MLARLLGACVWVDLPQRCTRIFQSVCRGALAPEPVKLVIRGFESRRAPKSVSPVDWFCPSGHWKNGTRKLTSVCENVFIMKIRYHSAKREMLLRISRSNAKASLAWEWIPCYPKQCQKISFRTVQEALKFSAAAFAWVIAESTEFMIGVII